MSESKPVFTQGICHDGAAILKDGNPVTIEEILASLSREADLEEALRQARAVMLKAAEDKEAGRMWNISYPLSAASAKIASVLDNTEESAE